MEQSILTKAVELVAVWLPIVTSFVGSFALLAAVTKNKTDDKIIQAILDVINFLGANFGKARNKED